MASDVERLANLGITHVLNCAPDEVGEKTGEMACEPCRPGHPPLVVLVHASRLVGQAAVNEMPSLCAGVAGPIHRYRRGPLFMGTVSSTRH